MKRLLLAGILLSSFALAREGARAERGDALGSLVGMADSAASDQGPDADLEAVHPDAPETAKSSSGPSGGVKVESSSAAPAVESKPPAAEAKAQDKPAKKDDGEPAVSIPAAPAPRVWTRLFASLLPPMTRVPSFEVDSSTAPRRSLRAPSRSAMRDAAAGSAQGLLEVVSAATAPAVP